MRTFIVAILATCFSFFSFAQETASKANRSSAIKPNKVYKLNVTPYGASSTKIKGFLLHIGDTALQVSPSEITFGSPGGNSLPYYNLGDVSIVQKGKLGRMIGYGTLGGIILGGLIGYTTYSKSEPTPDSWFTLDIGPGFNALGGSIIGALSGALVGVIIGSIQHRFRISGSKEKYDTMRRSLLVY